jgi:hypothetical protein
MITTTAGNPRAGVPQGAWVFLLLVLGASGCGFGEAGVGEVTGTVTFKDRLLTSGDVLMVTADGQKKWGAISPEGKYRVKDVPVGPVTIAVKDRPRAPPGLTNFRPPGRKAPPAEPYVQIPRKYTEPEKSGLTYTVERGPQTFHIKLVP